MILDNIQKVPFNQCFVVVDSDGNISKFRYHTLYKRLTPNEILCIGIKDQWTVSAYHFNDPTLRFLLKSTITLPANYDL